MSLIAEKGGAMFRNHVMSAFDDMTPAVTERALRKLCEEGHIQVRKTFWDGRALVVFMDNDAARQLAKTLIARHPGKENIQ